MANEKQLDRHGAEPRMVVYPMRIEVDSLAAVRRIAKKLDRTNQYVLREAVRFYLARRKP